MKFCKNLDILDVNGYILIKFLINCWSTDQMPRLDWFLEDQELDNQIEIKINRSKVWSTDENYTNEERDWYTE